MKSLSVGRANIVLFAALLGIAVLQPHRAAAESHDVLSGKHDAPNIG